MQFEIRRGTFKDCKRQPHSDGVALDFTGRTRYGRSKARYPSGKGEVCKTFMRGFDSHPRLQPFNNLHVVARFTFGSR
jgi:hypothetical protein